MKKLLKLHHLNSDMQYYQLIVSTYNSSGYDYAELLFKAMPKANRIKFIQFSITVWNNGLPMETLSNLIAHI